MDERKGLLAADCTATHGVDRWVICIGGFTQRLGQHTGIHRLWLRLRSMFCEQAQVELYPWHAPWDEIAELVKISRNGKRPRVAVLAYSWGAGWGFTRLARGLEGRGIDVDHAVLCDPVYRSRWLSFQWRSLIGRPQIRVPSNVKQVEWLLQRDDWPRAHALVRESRRTLIARPIDLTPVCHSSMDEQDEFYRMAVAAAGAVCAGK